VWGGLYFYQKSVAGQGLGATPIMNLDPKEEPHGVNV
jgi:hypothetical protein